MSSLHHTAPTAFRSDFLQVLSERGFLHQATDLAGLDERLARETVTAFIGFDATANSLHVGHLLSIMSLRWLQRTGHRPIVLLGGGTTRIGDPSFRDSSRPLLDEQQIAANLAGIGRVFDQFLRFGDGPTEALRVDNAEWLGRMDLLSFLRDVGVHFSVNRMLGFESVKQRLDREQPLTFLEFAYMILQSVDFVELARRHGCCLQMGGADQWGNIVNGIDLGRRQGVPDLFGLTTPLLTTSSGIKMGKSAGGAVWLNRDRLAPFEFWQFWRNTEDADVGRFLRLFTELPLEEIARLERLQGGEINEAKKILATSVTAMVHGEAAAQQAAAAAKAAFEEGTTAEGLFTLALDSRELEQGVEVTELLVRTGLCLTKGEARRLIVQGGARLEGQPVAAQARITLAQLSGKDALRLSAGKKKHARLTLAPGNS